MKKIDKYPEGYLPKLKYYAAELAFALKVGDAKRVSYLCRKYRWFYDRHALLYPAIPVEFGVDMRTFEAV